MLIGADLQFSTLVETNFERSQLSGAMVYGVSAWRLRLDGARQSDLIITPRGEPKVTVDDLEVAQFIYLLLDNKKLRQVIDTVTSKAVLILGRFSVERKQVLDAVREELRKRGYLPILFDFEKPAARDLSETISTLGHLARFVIADRTDARSIPQELKELVPSLPSVPIQPIILESQSEYGMFRDFGGYFSVLTPFHYKSVEHLLASLEDRVIGPACERAVKIEQRRKAFEAGIETY